MDKHNTSSLTMRIRKMKYIKRLFFLVIMFAALQVFGVFTHLYELNFETEFNYPYEGEIEEMVLQLQADLRPNVAPINSYTYKFHRDCAEKCAHITGMRLVYLVKSAPDHFNRRSVIRSTWGFERRFSDVEIRTVFLLGETPNRKTSEIIQQEADKFKDIVQGNFTDSYYNNTLKTMMGFYWAAKLCKNSRFYMFVDDDYYVSTRNVLKYIRNPVNFPNYMKVDEGDGPPQDFRRRLSQFDFDLSDNARLYSGFVFKSAPHRHLISKWYVSLAEYPYNSWPPYVTAGAIIISNRALLDMYFSSFYTKHFRFDDIYVGLLAFKAKIAPFHSNHFHFYKKTGDMSDVVASHGYGNTDELLNVWTHQKSLGNA